jgi:hypothetical protein
MQVTGYFCSSLTAIRGQREDVVERQCGDDDFLTFTHHRLQPGMRLHHVGNDVAVGQHGALGNTSCAAGVLKECNIVVADLYRIQLQAAALG